MSIEVQPELSINWSFSKLSVYENCAYRFKLQHIDKLPEPPRPPDNPLERGNREHERYERFIKGDSGALDSAEARAVNAFKPGLERLQELYAEGVAYAEDNWFFDKDWNVCERKDVWLWSKLDFLVIDEDESHAIVGDFKTGKSMYKAVEHIQQMQLYGAVTALKHPEIDRITVELWYVDEGHIKPTEWTREQALSFVGRFDARAARMYSDRFYRPNPNKITCAYCPYGPKRGTGVCPVGV